MKDYREDITRQQAEARRQALVQLLHAAGHAVDADGSPESLERLNVALISMGRAHGTEPTPAKRGPASHNRAPATSC